MIAPTRWTDVSDAPSSGHVEHAGLAFGLHDPCRAEHFDARVRDHRFKFAREPVGGRFRIRRARRECLLEAFHESAKLRLFFDEHNIVSGSGCVQCRADAGDAAAHDQHGLGDGVFRQRLQRLHLAGLHQAHADVVFGQRLGILVLRFVTPGDLFAQIDALQHHPGIE